MIIWRDWSKKLSSPHPPPLVPVDGATFVARQQRPPLVLRCRPGLDAAELPATYEIREQKSPATEAMSVFTAGMPAKLDSSSTS